MQKVSSFGVSVSANVNSFGFPAGTSSLYRSSLKHGLSHLRWRREPPPSTEASPYTKEPDLFANPKRTDIGWGNRESDATPPPWELIGAARRLQEVQCNTPLELLWPSRVFACLWSSNLCGVALHPGQVLYTTTARRIMWTTFPGLGFRRESQLSPSRLAFPKGCSFSCVQNTRRPAHL